MKGKNTRRSKRGMMSWLETVAWLADGTPELHYLDRSPDVLSEVREDPGAVSFSVYVAGLPCGHASGKGDGQMAQGGGPVLSGPIQRSLAFRMVR